MLSLFFSSDLTISIIVYFLFLVTDDLLIFEGLLFNL